MITLISGALGTGKTALAVKLLMESEYYPSSAFIFGVREWKGEGHYEELPQDPVRNQPRIESVGTIPQSVYLIDEAKKIWPSRIAGKPVPAFIDSHLAESRSLAQDWILTCQSPGQIDVRLRNLVGRHIHLERNPLGITYHEAGSCREDLKFSRDESRKYDFPKESLAFYRSDEGVTSHQKKGLKLPRRLFSIIGLLVLMAGILYWSISSLMTDDTVKKMVEGEPAVPVGELAQNNGSLSIDSYKNKGKPDDVLEPTHAPNKFYYYPRNPDYPELARAPRFPTACISSATRCQCFDQVQQKLDIDLKRCRDIVTGRNELAVLQPKQEKERIRDIEPADLETILIAQGHHPDEVRAFLKAPGLPSRSEQPAADVPAPPPGDKR